MRLVARKEGDSSGGLFDVTEQQAKELNLKGYAILTPVNEMPKGFKLDDVKAVRYWYVECDYKNSQKPSLKSVQKAFLWPSKVIETKSGYHIYWAARNSSKEKYRVIQDRLCALYAGDPNARNINRFLRAPGFYHMKDKDHPFLCEKVYETDVDYREELMLAILPKSPAELEEQRDQNQPKKEFKPTDDFHAWIDSQNQMELLIKLSGSRIVGGDTFKFVRVSGGKYNTYTNGKQSSWWIDRNGRIGSTDRGGPTVIQFCLWYGFYTYKELIDELKEFFK